VIFCSSDPEVAEAKTRSKWSRVLRYAKVAPTDLTVLTKKNNGVFPFDSVYEIIDGRKTVIAHGTRDIRFGATGICLSPTGR
jgi:hypothetical protein